MISPASIPSKLDGGDAEIGVTKLALDHIQRHSLARHLHRVGVAEPVRREARPYPGIDRDAAELGPDRGRRPGLTCGRSLEHAEQRSHWQLHPMLDPGTKLLPAPLVHADFAASPALAAADKHRPSGGLQVSLGERRGLPDPKPGAPEHYDQLAQSDPGRSLTRLAHHRHDLLHPWRVGG